MIEYGDLFSTLTPLRQIAADKKIGALNHAYLIEADGPLTQSITSTLAAQIIFCPKDGCGECEICHRVQGSGIADFIRIDKDKYDIKKDIEPIIDEAYRSNNGYGYKVFAILNMDIMTPAAQNKLLKLIEEPPKDTIFLLFTRNFYPILATVKSRCVKLSTDALSNDILHSYFDKQFDSIRLELAIREARGNLDKLLEILSSDEYCSLYNEVTDILTKIKSTKDIALYLNSTSFSKDNMLKSLDIIESVFSQSMEYCASNKEINETIKPIADFYGLEASINALNVIYTARAQLKSNCNATNVADALLTNLMEVKYKCRKL